MQPEFFPAVQILARLRRNFADRFAINCSFKINHHKIFNLRGALRNLDKVRRLFAQTFQCRVDLGLRYFRVRQFDRNIFVVGQFKLRRSNHSRLEPHRFVFAEMDPFQVRQRSDPQLFLFDRLTITLGDELLCNFVLNFLPKAFVDHRPWRFARPITGNFREPRKTVGNRVPFLRDFVRRQFDL